MREATTNVSANQGIDQKNTNERNQHNTDCATCGFKNQNNQHQRKNHIPACQCVKYWQSVAMCFAHYDEVQTGQG